MDRTTKVHWAAYVLGGQFWWIALFASAGEWRSTELNCTIQAPEGEDWLQVQPPVGHHGVVFQTRDRSKVVTLLVSPLSDAGQILNDKFIGKFETEYYPTGTTKKTSGEWMEVHGRRAHQSVGVLRTAGKESGRVSIQVIDGGRFYQMSGMVMGGDPLSDDQIQECLASFRFLSAPVTVVAEGGNPAAARIWYRLVQVLVLGAGIWGIWAFMKRQKKQPPAPRPPEVTSSWKRPKAPMGR